MEKKEFVNQREHFRIDFEVIPLYSELAIEKISGQRVESHKTGVQVKDISAGGLCFHSGLKFPIRDDVLIGFDLMIRNVEWHLTGKVLWCKDLPNGDLAYGVGFIFANQNQQHDLLQLLNHLQIDMRNGHFHYSKAPSTRRTA